MDFATQVAQRENTDQILSGAAKALWSAVSRPDFCPETWHCKRPSSLSDSMM